MRKFILTFILFSQYAPTLFGAEAICEALFENASAPFADRMAIDAKEIADQVSRRFKVAEAGDSELNEFRPHETHLPGHKTEYRNPRLSYRWIIEDAFVVSDLANLAEWSKKTL